MGGRGRDKRDHHMRLNSGGGGKEVVVTGSYIRGRQHGQVVGEKKGDWQKWAANNGQGNRLRDPTQRTSRTQL